MHFINPFRGLRPNEEKASSVTIPSTDHLSEEIITNHKKNNPWSYLNIFSNEISIIDPRTKPPTVYTDPTTGEPYKFKTGDKFRQADLDIINKIMEDAGYIKRQEQVDDATTYTKD